MARRKNWSAEEIIAKLRLIEVQLAQGKSLALACKEAEISEQSYYRWRRSTAGLPLSKPSASKTWSGRTLACAAWWPTSRSRSRS